MKPALTDRTRPNPKLPVVLLPRGGSLIAAIVASPSVVSLLVQTQSIANQAQDQMSEIDATAHKLAQQNQDLQNQITNLKKKVDLIDGKGGAQRKNTDVSRPRPNR